MSKKNKPVRIEVRYDPVEDRDMIDFIDEMGSTRAGFIKQVLKLYKNQVESMQDSKKDNSQKEANNTKTEHEDKQKNNMLPSFLKDTSFSSKDLDND